MLGSGLLLTTGAVLSLVFASHVYKATTRIWIDSSPESAALFSTNTSAFDPYWIRTPFEMIQSKGALYSAITNLNLTSRWMMKRGTQAPLSVEETYQLLRRQVEVRQHRSTSVFEIMVFSEDPMEVAQIANAIAAIYRDQVTALRKDRGVVPPNEAVQIVDSAEPPSRPSRERSSRGLLPVILFALGMVSIFTGYFLARSAWIAGVDIPPAGHS